jgi:hypothetical protein
MSCQTQRPPHQRGPGRVGKRQTLGGRHDRHHSLSHKGGGTTACQCPHINRLQCCHRLPLILLSQGKACRRVRIDPCGDYLLTRSR